VIGISAKKTRALLAYLALTGGRAHGRGKLADLLWSDRGDKQARDSLRQALAELRETLADVHPTPFATEHDLLALDPVAVEVDALEFERLAAHDSADELRRAVALYDGDLLDGLVVRDPVFDEWLRDQQQRYRELAVAVLKKLLRHETGTNAIATAQRLLALDPLQEEGHRALMRLYADAGDIAAALRQYATCCATLKRELDIAPSLETEALHRQIRDQSTAQPRSHSHHAAPSANDDVSQPLTATTWKPSVAVLPFRNLSGDPEQQYFSDGVTEDIITELARCRSLAVRAWHSTLALRGQSSDAAEVGRKLAVDYVLDGSVARAADEVRVTVRLSEVESGSQLWAERYARKPQDLFAVQDDVVRTIVATLLSRLEDAGAQRAMRKHPGSLAAYDYLLRGIELHNRMTPEDEPVARKMLEQAIALDPELALAHSWLAVSYMVDWFNQGSREAFDHALNFAERGVALDDDDGRCHATLGYVSLYHRQFERADFHFNRAIALMPNDFRAICGKGVLLAYFGEHGVAIEWLTTAVRLNPYPPEWYAPVLGMALYSARRYAEALAMLAVVGSVSPWPSIYLAACLARLNRLDEARAGITKWSTEWPTLSMVEYARNEPFKNSADLEHLLEGLSKAGLLE
jgi:TolB-like protein